MTQLLIVIRGHPLHPATVFVRISSLCTSSWSRYFNKKLLSAASKPQTKISKAVISLQQAFMYYTMNKNWRLYYNLKRIFQFGDKLNLYWGMCVTVTVPFLGRWAREGRCFACTNVMFKGGNLIWTYWLVGLFVCLCFFDISCWNHPWQWQLNIASSKQHETVFRMRFQSFHWHKTGSPILTTEGVLRYKLHNCQVKRCIVIIFVDVHSQMINL